MNPAFSRGGGFLGICFGSVTCQRAALSYEVEYSVAHSDEFAKSIGKLFPKVLVTGKEGGRKRAREEQYEKIDNRIQEQITVDETGGTRRPRPRGG